MNQDLLTSNTRTKISNACVLVLILSALLFDRFPALHWICAALAAVAVALSGFLYLSIPSPSKAVARELVATAECLERQQAAESLERQQEEEDEKSERENILLSVDDDLLSRYVMHQTFMHQSQSARQIVLFYRNSVFAKIEKRRTIANEVVDIVRELTPADESEPKYEFELTTDGRFFIRPHAKFLGAGSSEKVERLRHPSFKVN